MNLFRCFFLEYEKRPHLIGRAFLGLFIYGGKRGACDLCRWSGSLPGFLA